jgi:hypothetical protein
MTATMHYGIFSGDPGRIAAGFTDPIMRSWLEGYARSRKRRTDAGPDPQVDPAQFGIAPGMRAAKARRSNHRGRELAKMTSDFSRATTAQRAACSGPSNPQRATSRWYAAAHEAGHAVVAHRLGLEVGQARVRADGSGVCLVRGGSYVDNAVSAMAGNLAEERAAGRSLCPGDGDGGLIDKLIRQAVPGYGKRAARNELWIACRREAKRLVDRHWPAIERVADALCDGAELTGDQLAGVL